MATKEKLPRKISRLGLLAGFVAAETYSAYASFIGHALQPVSVLVFDRNTHQRLPAGHLGDLETVVHWQGFIAIVLISIVVFGLTCGAAPLAAKCIRQLMAASDPIAPDRAPETQTSSNETAIANA